MNKVLDTIFRKALPKLQTGEVRNKDGGLRHRGILVLRTSRRSKGEKVSLVVIPRRSKRMRAMIPGHSSPRRPKMEMHNNIKSSSFETTIDLITWPY